MSSKAPIVRQMSFVSVIIHLSLVAIFAFLFYRFDKVNNLLFSLLLFIILSYTLRYFIPRDHRKGVSLFKQKKYDLAIPCFQKSYEYFIKNQWIDRYRYITLLSSSRISYTEMSLLNIAFCQSQVGNKNEAIKYYRKVIDEYGDNEIAITALRMLT